MSTERSILDESMHLIPLEQGVAWTSMFRKEKENILVPELQNKQILPLSETFSRSAFDMLLSQDGCVGIRLYLGMDTSNKLHSIAVGVNGNNEDIIIAEKTVLIENALRCPTDCPPPSVLNV